MSADMTTQDEFSWFWTGLDTDIAASLSEDQKLAIANAMRKSAVSTQPTDIRMSLFGHFFVLISGKERRSSARVKEDQVKNPAMTLRNLPMLVCIWAAMIYGTWGVLGLVGDLLATQ